MARFQMIRSTRGWKVHVGVLDTQRKKVLELVTPDLETVKIQEIHVDDFGEHQHHEPANAVDDDDTILARWQSVMREYKEAVRKNESWRYDAGGAYHKGQFNCENLAEWVMTAIPDAPMGKWAGWLKDWLGIDIARSQSGRPGTSGNSWSS